MSASFYSFVLFSSEWVLCLCSWGYFSMSLRIAFSDSSRALLTSTSSSEWFDFGLRCEKFEAIFVIVVCSKGGKSCNVFSKFKCKGFIDFFKNISGVWSSHPDSISTSAIPPLSSIWVSPPRLTDSQIILPSDSDSIDLALCCSLCSNWCFFCCSSRLTPKMLL